MSEKVGFIGVGVMGKPMCINIIKGGYPVVAYDIRDEALEEVKKEGAEVEQSCKAVAEKSDIVITVLPNAPDVEEAITGKEGIIEGIGDRHVVIDMSTIDPYTSRRMAEVISAKGAKMLDAPVSGGQMGAVAGNLAIMVGGDKDLFEKVRKILECMGKKLFYCGPNGNGELVKITNNLLAAVIIAANVEALVMGVKAGVDFNVLFEAINASSGQNFSLQNYFPMKAFKGDFEPGFTTDLMLKDLGLAMSVAKEEGVPVPIGSLAYQTYSLARAMGLGKKDITILVKMMEDLTKTELRLK